ncbi:hypothetical protein GCM10010840_26160 [Deinococcus aerolatus]|uniref:Integrase catalytic domain-containing protein n=1 Tax=Deinococcus aerolatus TaxID=522487 RepID=A0ABQ2GDJ4_9DEIO|nr:IS3 family transposase [Deinococcus aerolatus]GGL87035.1 hypothetical protein GCM10010840_26160 [Deinococcus aerolatus]
MLTDEIKCSFDRSRGTYGTLRLKADLAEKGDCWDKAVVESFFDSPEWELFENNISENRMVVRHAISEYTLVFYNRQRWHSTQGDLTPHEFERQAEAA